MKDKRKIIFGLLTLIIFMVTISATYAFFSADVRVNKEEIVTVQMGALSLIFSDTVDDIQDIKKTMNFDDVVEKELKIENNGTVDAAAVISWEDLINTYLSQSLTYTLEYKEKSNDEWQFLPTVRKNVPRTEESKTLQLSEEILVPAKTTYTFRLRIKLEYLNYVDQTGDINARFSTKFTISEPKKLGGIMKAVMTANEDGKDVVNYANPFIFASMNATKIVFEDKIRPIEGATEYDFTDSGSEKKVLGYLVTNDDSTKTLYVQSDGKVVANESSRGLFAFAANVTSIEGLENLDTSSVKDMGKMFSGRSKLVNLDLSSFDTSNVVDMTEMFNGCENLKNIDIGYNFKGENVTNMSSMFNNCKRLENLDLSNFNTIKVTNLNKMFNYCFRLKYLDLDKFDTQNVTDMGDMFHYCEDLIYLHWGDKFTTQNVTNMRSMFSKCFSLRSLDVSNFDTSNVTSMGWMFEGCTKLTLLDVSNFDTSNVTSMAYMFYGCERLKMLDVSNFDTSNVTSMAYMFYGCISLTSLDVGNFDTSNVTNMEYMFSHCRSLTSLVVSNFDTSNVTNMGRMFNGCISLTSLDLRNLDISKITATRLYIFSEVNPSIIITVSNDTLKQRIIDDSGDPKLTDANFIIG